MWIKAENGTLINSDYVSNFAVSVIDMETVGLGAYYFKTNSATTDFYCTTIKRFKDRDSAHKNLEILAKKLGTEVI